MITEASAQFSAVATIGAPTPRLGTAAELSADPLIWADPRAIAAIPAGSFRQFGGPRGRCWAIRRLPQSVAQSDRQGSPRESGSQSRSQPVAPMPGAGTPAPGGAKCEHLDHEDFYCLACGSYLDPWGIA